MTNKKAPAPAGGHRGWWTWLVVAGLVLVLWDWNLGWLSSVHDWATQRYLAENDWSILRSLDPADPYANAAFHWSVPAAWLWAGLVVPMGFAAWTVLHFAALATLGSWRVVLLALVTFPFWFDVASGNVLTFAFVLAWHALAGRRWAAVGFVALTALVPRPLMLPVLAWFLWHRTDARWAFAGASVLVVGAGLATGTLGPWLAMLAGTPGNELAAPWNVGPSSVFGAAWVPVGLVLAAYLTAKGRLGLASLCASPYLIHYYAIFGLLEMRRDRPLAERDVATAIPAKPDPMHPADWQSHPGYVTLSR